DEFCLAQPVRIRKREKMKADCFMRAPLICVQKRSISQAEIAHTPYVGRFLENRLGNPQLKIAFAKQWCQHHPGPVLDLGNPSGQLALALVKEGVHTSTLESDPFSITNLRSARETLGHLSKDLFQIYPFDFSKFEIDQKFQTIFCSPQVMEEPETELSILGGLRQVLAHLNSEGSFFAEVHNLDFFELHRPFRDESWRYLEDCSWLEGRSRVWERTYAGTKESQTVFEYAVSNELNDFLLYRTTLHLFNQDQWMKLFEVAGFLVEDCFGDWKGTEPNSQHPCLIFHLKAR
ncbi:MAG: hypothetical protein ACKOA8_00615, partial [Deltaproteobacteria bacterium]